MFWPQSYDTAPEHPAYVQSQPMHYPTSGPRPSAYYGRSYAYATDGSRECMQDCGPRYGHHSHWPLHFIEPSAPISATTVADAQAGLPSRYTARVAEPILEPTMINGSSVGGTSESGHEVRVLDPKLASNLERHTCAALARIYPGKVFEKLRPPWLRNPRTGRACELDFYNEELKLGLEVQGMQHYVYSNSWHKSRAEWEEQVYRDRLKEESYF